MRMIVLLTLIATMAISCEPHEPLLQPTSSTQQVDESTDIPAANDPGSLVYADASGAEYILYFSSGDKVLDTLHSGNTPYSSRIGIPDVTPLDLWLVTVPSKQDSVRLNVGCIQIRTINRIRMVVKN